MSRKPTYEELGEKVRELEKESSHRKLVTEELRAHYSMIEDILQRAADGICVCHNITEEPYVRFTHWNPRMTEITGYTMEEINKLGWYQSMYPDPEVQRRAIERMARMLVGDDIKAEEWVITAKDGEKRALSISTSIVREEDGKVHVLAVMQDVTERRRAEETLKEKEKSYRTLAENLPGIVYRVHSREHGRMQFFNDMLPTMTGYNEQELVQGETCSIDPLIVGEDRDKVIAEVNEGIREKRAFSVEYRITHKDGSPRIFIERGKPIFDSNGLLCIDGIIQDITARRQAEAALRQSEEKFKFLAEKMADIVWTLDLDLCTTYVSPSVEKVLGFTPEERKRQSLGEMITPESLQRIQLKFVEELGRDGGISSDPDRSVTMEVEYYRKDGTTVWMENSVKAMRDQSGSIVGIYGVSRDITGRKQAEEKLQESRNMLQTVLDSIPSAVFWKDRDSNYLGGNRTWLEAVGLKSLEEVVGKSDYDLPWTKEQADSFRKGDSRIMASGVPEYGIIEPYLRADGCQAWARTNKVPLRDLEGNVTGILGTYEDITDRKQAEEALRESERKYKGLIETALDGYVMTDMQGRILDCNMAYLDMLGYTMEEVRKLSYQDLTPPRWHKMEEEVVKGQFIKRGYSDEYEKEYIRKNGDVFPISIRGRLITDERNEPVGMWGFVRDITQRKRAEEALRSSEEKFQTIYRQSQVGIEVYDAKGRLIEINPACQEIFGVEGTEVVRGFDLFSAPNVPPDVLSRLERGEAVKYEATFDFELVRQRALYSTTKSGQCFLNCLITPLRGQDDSISGYLVHAEDITERKRAEEKRRKLEEQLWQARKAESLGRMAGAIAHHYNNLMGAVLGNLELALDKLPRESKPGDHIAEAMKASRRAADISQLMLSYLGHGIGAKKPLDLSEICRVSLPLFGATFPGGLRLKTEFPPSGPIIQGNAEQIRQVLSNLVTNAVEAMGDREGDVTVTIEVMPAASILELPVHPTGWRPKDESYACLSIADTGCGMDKETVDKVFDPFFSTKFTGRGLGLPVVAGIVKAHEGAVSVESVEGQGTVLRVFLPLTAVRNCQNPGNQRQPRV